jgi:hypothetical protein
VAECLALTVKYLNNQDDWTKVKWVDGEYI